MINKNSHKILLVDDDSKNLQVAMSILKNYNVIFAQSGEKALELVKKNKFDLILLDIVMPGLDGYAVCKILKADEETNKIPIVFLTVKDEEKDIVKGFELGAVDYVIKPFYSEVLIKRVETHLKLATTLKELEHLNNNLSLKVNEQVEEIRKKDEIILRKSKMEDMSNMMDVIASKWKKPLDNLNLYLQTLSFSFIDNLDNSEVFEKTLEEVKNLDEVMSDFQKFFTNSDNKKITNIKVLIDNAIFSVKDKLDKKNIKVEVEGDNLLFLKIDTEEIKHIFKKLLLNSFENFENRKNQVISIKIVDSNDRINIHYYDNSASFNKDKLNSLYDVQKSIQDKDFDLGFFLIKIFSEKNNATLDVLEENGKIEFKLSFHK